MAKQTLWQRIRSWFRGDEKKSAPKPRQNRDARHETVSTRTSAPSYNRRALLDSLRDKKSEEEEKRVKNEAFKATKYDAKDIGESLKKTVKKDVPDPKQKILKERAEKREEEKKKRIEASAPYKKKIDEKYKTRKSGASAYVKTGNYAADPDVAKYNVLRHPVATSATRGAVSGASFGASELAIKKNPWQTEEQRKAEEFYQKNKNAKAEMAGEIVGSLASFGGTAKATDRLGEKVIEKAAPRAAEKLAGTKLIQNAAKKSVTKAVEKGAVKSASKELIEQVGKDRAKKIVNAVGNDIVQNATTGLLYDFNKASTEYEVGTPEWWREMGKSAAFNAAITGVVGVGSAVGGGKRLVKNADEFLTHDPARRSAAAKARGAVFGKAAKAERDLDRSLVNEGTYGDIRRGILPPSEIEINGTRDIKMPTRNIGNAERIEPLAATRDRILRNAEANANVGGGSARLEDLVRIPRRSDARISAINKELDEISDAISRGRNTASDEELDALINRFDELMAERNALENSGTLYHAGDGGKAEWYGNQAGSRRGTGHFGTGTYAAGDEDILIREGYGNRPINEIDASNYELYRPQGREQGMRVHNNLKKLNVESGDIDSLAKRAHINEKDVPKLIDEYDRATTTEDLERIADRLFSKQDREAIAGAAEERLKLWRENGVNPDYDFDIDDEIADMLGDVDLADIDFNDIDAVLDLAAERSAVKNAGRPLPPPATIEQAYRTELSDSIGKFLNNISENGNETRNALQQLGEDLGATPEQVDTALELTQKVISTYEKNGIFLKEDSASTIFMKALGYEGVNVKGIEGLDNTEFGSVIYDLRPEDMKLIREGKPKAKGAKKKPPKATSAPKSEGFERYAEHTAKQERMMQEGGEKADAIRAELANKPAKGAKPAAERLKTAAKSEDVSQFAGVSDDVSGIGFNAESEKLYQAGKKVEAAADNANTGKSDFDKLKDEAYAQSGTGLNTDGKEQMTAGEAREFFDSEWRTTQEHTKRGFSTIAVTGDKGFKGIAHDALKNGETVVDVYHDKENLAAGAQRVMSKADQEGGINQMIKDFNDYASNKLRLTENERRDQIYDCIAAVDFANANKDQPWSGELFLAACRAGAEQTSGSGLSLHMWHKMAMSSPAHRAKAVREQILDMFNRSAGMRKALNKGKGDKIKIDELDDVLKKNPALQKVLEELDNMDAATSKDEVERVASKALLHARKAMPMTVLDQLTQWRYVAMLSSPKTHIRNITSNIYSATLGQLRDAIASGTEESLIKGKGKYGKKFQEAVKAGKIDKNNYHKSAGGLSWKAFSDSHTGTKSGFTLNRLNSKLEKTRLELEATSAKDATKIERLNNRIKDLEARQKEAQKAYDKAIAKLERGEAKQALDSWNGMGKEKLVANAEKWERRQYNGTVSKGVFKMNDKMSNFIGNALETSDALSLERIYREKFDKILTANDWSGLSKRAAGGDQEAAAALKQLEEYASQEAAYTAALDTYRNYNALSSAMNKFVNDSLFNYDAPIYKKVLGAGLHAIMPFTKVPVNLLKRGIDYSPVGLMTAKRNLTRAIESGNITEINRACERLAEGKIGTGIVALGAGLGFADPDGDLITGRLHDTDYIDKKKKDAGYQNYSVTLGDHNFTLDWATPTAASMFTGVEFGRMLRRAFDQMASDEGLQFNFWKAFDVPLILASTTLEPTLQLGVFQGINDTLESVVKSDNYDDSGTNVNPALKIVASIAGNYVNSQISPAILSQLSRSFSPYDYFVTGETDPEYAFTQQLAKTPLAGKYLGAKTNVWGQIKNEKTDAGDYAKAAAKNLLSPANINKVTWDETDEWAKEFYEKTGYQGAFPKNNYNKTVEVGRIKGAHTLEMTKKEMAEYNVQRGKSGEDAMRDALNTVVFNRYDKDSQGHRTIAHADNISPEEREKIAKQFAGKGIKEVVDYIRNTPQFKKATVAEQKQILDAIYGASGGDDDQAKGAKRSAQRYIAGKKGISANEYDYYNETPRRVQESLQEAIDSGLITYEQALDFTRNAGKTYYTTDERGEKGGTVVTNYNKKEMMEYLSKKGYSYEEAEALYNAYKQANAKDFNGIDLSSGGRGYRRRYGGYRHYGGGSRSKKVPALKQSSYKATKRTYKDTATTLKTSSSRSKGLSTASPVKVEPPKVKFKKYEV